MLKFELDVHQTNSIIAALNFQCAYNGDLIRRIQTMAAQQIAEQQAQSAAAINSTSASTGEQNGDKETSGV